MLLPCEIRGLPWHTEHTNVVRPGEVVWILDQANGAEVLEDLVVGVTYAYLCSIRSENIDKMYVLTEVAKDMISLYHTWIFRS